MTVPAAATLQSCNVELGRTATQSLYMNDTIFRDLAKGNVTPNSAVQLSQTAGNTCKNITFTVGKDPSLAVYGYSNNTFSSKFYGSASPDANLFGAAINYATQHFGITIYGAIPQNFWSRMMFRTSAAATPVWRTASSNASYSQITVNAYAVWDYPAAPFDMITYYPGNVLMSIVQ